MTTITSTLDVPTDRTVRQFTVTVTDDRPNASLDPTLIKQYLVERFAEVQRQCNIEDGRPADRQAGMVQFDVTNKVNDADELAALRERCLNYEVTNESLRAMVNRIESKHRNDIEIIGRALLDEAENRGWCSEFDTFVDKVNGLLYISLITRKNEYVIRRAYLVEVECTVTATSELDALDQAPSFAPSWRSGDGDWEVVDSGADYKNAEYVELDDR